MKIAYVLYLAAVMGGLLSLPAEAEETQAPAGLLQRAAEVDDPIPETYEPLNSTYVDKGEQLDDTIEQSWQLQKAAEDRGTSATDSSGGDDAERELLESRIQEPGLSPRPEPEPAITDTGDSLRIQGE